MEKMAKILSIPFHRSETADPHALDSRSRKRRSTWFALIVAVVIPGLYGAGIVLARHDDAAAIQQLPPEARRALYDGTLHELETICRTAAAASGDLRDHCVAQARFVLKLPDCTGVCQRVAAATLPHAH